MAPVFTHLNMAPKISCEFQSEFVLLHPQIGAENEIMMV